jgi:hypothetical protein
MNPTQTTVLSFAKQWVVWFNLKNLAIIEVVTEVLPKLQVFLGCDAVPLK